MKTLNVIFEEMIDYRRSLNMSPETEKSLRYQTNQFLSFLAVNYNVISPAELRKSHLFAYQKHLATITNRQGLPLKPGSVNNLVSAAKSLLRFMHRHGYITSHLEEVLRKVKTPTLLPTSVLTHSQVKRLIRSVDTSSAEGLRNRVVMELLYSSGIRVGELVRLKVNDIDLENGIMKVFGKGSKERMVPIGKTALQYLCSYIRGVRPFINFKHCEEVFLNTRGTPLTRHKVELIMRNISSKEIIKDVKITPHTFRRSCATEMIRGNANMYHVKELLGHSSLATLKHYTKLTINDLRKTHSKCHPRERDS